MWKLFHGAAFRNALHNDAEIGSESEPLWFGFMMSNKRGNNQEAWIQPKQTLNGKIQPGLAPVVLTTNIVLDGENQKSLPTARKGNYPWYQHVSLVLSLPFPWNTSVETCSLCLGYFKLQFLIQSDKVINIYFLSLGGFHGWYVSCWNSAGF